MNDFLPHIETLTSRGPTEADVIAAKGYVNRNKLIALLQGDVGLQKDRQQSLTQMVGDMDMSDLFGGAIGGLLAHTLAKYAKLPNTAQTLLSLAGFGAGAILSQHSRAGNYISQDASGVYTIQL